MMEQILQEGLTALGLPTSNIPALIRYAELLVEKNKVMNLTAITDPADIAALHFLDSAALLTLADFRGKRVADIGTGAGFPGMPLRILEPTLHMTLLDSLNKRIDFLQEVCQELGLSDVECVHARAEEFAAQHRESFRDRHIPCRGKSADAFGAVPAAGQGWRRLLIYEVRGLRRRIGRIRKSHFHAGRARI